MIIENENNVPTLKVDEPYKRTLKVLLSPLLHRELESLSAGLTIIPPGGRSDKRKHKSGEMFYVISGRGVIKVGSEEARLKAGTVIWVPPFFYHFLLNNSSKILKILWILCPPGGEEKIVGQACRKSMDLKP